MDMIASNQMYDDEMFGDDYYDEEASSIELTPSELLAIQTSSYFDENNTISRTDSLAHTPIDGVAGTTTIMEENEEDEEEIVEA